MGLHGFMRLEQTAFTHLLSHSFSSPRSHQGEPMPARYWMPQNARIGSPMPDHASMLRCFDDRDEQRSFLRNFGTVGIEFCPMSAGMGKTWQGLALRCISLLEAWAICGHLWANLRRCGFCP